MDLNLPINGQYYTIIFKRLRGRARVIRDVSRAAEKEALSDERADERKKVIWRNPSDPFV
jgi:hypothetical protein